VTASLSLSTIEKWPPSNKLVPSFYCYHASSSTASCRLPTSSLLVSLTGGCGHCVKPPAGILKKKKKVPRHLNFSLSLCSIEKKNGGLEHYLERGECGRTTKATEWPKQKTSALSSGLGPVILCATLKPNKESEQAAADQVRYDGD